MAYVLIATDNSVNKYKGNSIDTKPSGVPSGSRCFETDTRRVWVYDSSHKNPGTNTNWWPDYVNQEDFLDLLNDSVNDAQLGDIVTINNHITTYTYNSDGTVSGSVEKDGDNNTIKTVAYTYTNGVVTSSVTTMNGKTITTTYNYDTNDNITSVTNVLS